MRGVRRGIGWVRRGIGSTVWTRPGALATIEASKTTRCFLADTTRPLEPPPTGALEVVRN